MSDYYDDEGNSLGHWEPISDKEYVRLVDVVLGPDRTVFASRTEIGESLGDGRFRDQIKVTEWGRAGDAVPLARCDDRWDHFGERTHNDYRFVKAQQS